MCFSCKNKNKQHKKQNIFRCSLILPQRHKTIALSMDGSDTKTGGAPVDTAPNPPSGDSSSVLESKINNYREIFNKNFVQLLFQILQLLKDADKLESNGLEKYMQSALKEAYTRVYIDVSADRYTDKYLNHFVDVMGEDYDLLIQKSRILLGERPVALDRIGSGTNGSDEADAYIGTDRPGVTITAAATSTATSESAANSATVLSTGGGGGTECCEDSEHAEVCTPGFGGYGDFMAAVFMIAESPEQQYRFSTHYLYELLDDGSGGGTAESDARDNWWTSWIHLYRIAVLISVYTDIPIVRVMVSLLWNKKDEMNLENSKDMVGDIVNNMVGDNDLKSMVDGYIQDIDSGGNADNEESPLQRVVSQLQKIVAVFQPAGSVGARPMNKSEFRTYAADKLRLVLGHVSGLKFVETHMTDTGDVDHKSRDNPDDRVDLRKLGALLDVCLSDAKPASDAHIPKELTELPHPIPLQKLVNIRKRFRSNGYHCIPEIEDTTPGQMQSMLQNTDALREACDSNDPNQLQGILASMGLDRHISAESMQQITQKLMANAEQDAAGTDEAPENDAGDTTSE